MTASAPEGARQALTTGASTLLVITVAFAAWWTFDTEADAGLVLGLAGLALVALGAVPALAASASASLRPARWAYALGALLALAALAAGVWQALAGDEAGDADTQVPARVSVHTTAPKAAPALHRT